MMAMIDGREYARWQALRIIENDEERDRALQARTQGRLKGR